MQQVFAIAMNLFSSFQVGIIQSLCFVFKHNPGKTDDRIERRPQFVAHIGDEFTAQFAADLCGRADRLKTRYTIAESGQGAHVSLLTGRATASTQTITASKFYSMEPDYVFRSRVFMELQNAQAVVLPYDGLNPLPPQYCYLKPHYLDVQTSYFDQVTRGTL